MKRLLLAGALFALTALLVSACTSPTDVAAGRKVTKDPIVSSLSVQKDVNFGTVKPNITTTVLVEVRNTSVTESVTITDIHLKDGTKGFQLSGPALPITLGRKGQNDVVTIPVVFRGGTQGEFRDELVINNDPTLTCRVVATITSPPAIIVTDLDFGTFGFGTKKVMKGYIINDGDADAIITAATIQGPSAGDFQCELMDVPLPRVVRAGESMDFNVIFSSTQVGQATATIDVEIMYSGSGTVDNISVLTGNVVP